MSETELSTDELQAVLLAAPRGADFVAAAIGRLGSPASVALRAEYARVPRKLGAFASTALNERVAHTEHWSSVDWARLWLLRRSLELTPHAEQPGEVERLFEGGEIGEQVSLLRTLRLLPEPERFGELAVNACRTNAVAVFEAIACDNPYPARYFPQLSFNQLVMKAVFMELRLARVIGLAPRIDGELVRMAHDLCAERRAAGRNIPDDLAELTRRDARS